MNLKRLFSKIFPTQFRPYWNKIKTSPSLDKDIKKITNAFVNSESYNYVSTWWHVLNIKNFQSLIDVGISKYGTDISTNYYTFFDLPNEHLAASFENLRDNLNIKLNGELFKIQNDLNYKESFFYNYVCLLLYENLKKTKYLDHLKKLKDNTYLGFNDPFIKIDGINISTDKLVSLFDLEHINEFNDLANTNSLLEIGAGSGRLSECILSFYNNINYVICDIPPALYISYCRLKKAFPKKKISILVENNDQNLLQDEIKHNDISFILPHQLELLKKNSFDTVLAVDCLHEMEKKTISSYFNLINKLTNNFYFSIWKKTKVLYSARIFKKTERLDFEKNDYPIHKNWKLTHKKNFIFPGSYFSIGYKIDDN